MELVVLNIAYPFARVGPDTSGAEKILAQLDAALIQSGHESIVMACEGSSTEGILLATPKPSSIVDATECRRIHEQYQFTLQSFLKKWPIDLIHMHGVDFYEYLPPVGIPVLVTLHAPIDQYPESIFHLDRPQTYLHCISNHQRAACPPSANILDEAETGLGTQPVGDGLVERYFAIYEQLVSQARASETAAPFSDKNWVAETVHA
jgi:hypothetical protein